MSPKWVQLTSPQQVEDLVKRSYEQTCLIFKHSHRCSISHIAQHRLDDDWSKFEDSVEPFFVDVISARPVSNFVSEFFQVEHESPQVLLVRDGECFFDTSHLDVSAEEILEALETAPVNR